MYVPYDMSKVKVLDLSQNFSADSPAFAFYEGPTVKWVKRLAFEGVNAQFISTTNHIATHLDSPIHFYDPGPDIVGHPARHAGRPGLHRRPRAVRHRRLPDLRPRALRGVGAQDRHHDRARRHPGDPHRLPPLLQRGLVQGAPAGEGRPAARLPEAPRPAQRLRRLGARPRHPLAGGGLHRRRPPVQHQRAQGPARPHPRGREGDRHVPRRGLPLARGLPVHARQALPARRLPRREPRRADRRGAQPARLAGLLPVPLQGRRGGLLRGSWPSWRRNDRRQPVGERTGATRTRACSPGGPSSSTTSTCPDGARRLPAQPARPRPPARHRRLPGAAARRGDRGLSPPRTSATTGSRARCWCRRRRSRAWSSTSAPRCRSPRTRSATSASRSPWWSPRRRYVAEDALPRHPGRLRAAARGGGPRDAPWSRARPWSTRTWARTSPRTWSRRRGTTRRRAPQADVVVRRRFSYDRGASAAIENRGVVAQWDARDQKLTVWDTTQAPIPIRNGLAAMLGLSEHQVRVVAPFIGGGFGPKIMMFYPEEVLVPWLAIRLERPVKWIEDRAENFVATTQERGQIHDAEIALTRDGRILGVKDSFLHDTGAYDPYGLTVPLNSQCTVMGPYRVPAYASEFRAVFTNKTDRHPLPRRRPPARRLRDRAADGPRGPRAGHRQAGDPAAQLPATGRVPARPRDHLPGLRPALLRQRQLRAGARQGDRHDRLRALRPRGAAAAARRGSPRGDRRSSPTSRAPASAPSRAPACRCRRAAR